MRSEKAKAFAVEDFRCHVAALKGRDPDADRR